MHRRTTFETAIVQSRLTPRQLENPKPVFQSDLAHHSVVEAAPVQRREQMLQATCIPDGARHHSAIKITSKGYSILAQAPHQILDMARDHIEGGVLVEIAIGTDIIHRKIKPDDPIRLSDRIELSVGEIAVERQIVWAQECVATSGAVLKAATSQKPRSLR
jgi:hypothetical protein